MRLSLFITLATAGTMLAASITWGCTDLFHSTDFGGKAVDPLSLPVDFCTWAPDEAQRHATEACTRLVACQNGFGSTPNAVGDCIKNAMAAYDCSIAPNRPVKGGTRDLWDCLWRAQSCSGDPNGHDVQSCVLKDHTFTCSAPNSTSCGTNDLASTRLECFDQNSTASFGDPCAATGRTCSTLSNQPATCTGSAGANCTRTGCDADNQLHLCADAGTNLPYDRGFDCTSYGAGKCVDSDAGPACAVLNDAGAPPCTPTAAVTCLLDANNNPTVASGCPSGVPETFNCGRLGLQCVATSDGESWDVSRACPPPTTSGPACTKDQCDGDKLLACVRGVQKPIDCVGLKLGACQPLAVAGSSEPQASCQPAH